MDKGIPAFTDEPFLRNALERKKLKEFKSAKELLDYINKYSPDQERDERGRFSSGGSGEGSKTPTKTYGGYTFKEPETKPPAETVPQDARELAATFRENAVVAEPAITESMIDTANRVGAEMVGLDFRIKSEDSLARKIVSDADKDFEGDREKATENIGDGVRYTMQFSPEEYAERVIATVKDLEEQGYEMKVKNYWQEGNAYKGINVAMTAEDGTKFELQFHTPISHEIKEGEAHPLYQQWREEKDPAIKQELDTQMRIVGAKVPYPDNRDLLNTIGIPKFD